MVIVQSIRRIGTWGSYGVEWFRGLGEHAWDRALAMLRAAAKAVPFNPLLGWDLAFTSEGPVLVEANDLWDLDIPQLAADQGLLATPLGPYLERRGLLRMRRGKG